MARDLGLADRLRARGLRVVEVDGWRTRGKVEFAPRSAVNHHTAGSAKGNAPSLGVCINGRSDLPGPLCHVLLARDLTCYVIAAGKANHAGVGNWRGLTGNSTVYGLEIENVGTQAEPWRPEVVAAAYQIHAAFLEGVPAADRVEPCQHKEWATPPGRKTDAHDPWTGAQLRAGVAAVLAPPPDPPQEESDMKHALFTIDPNRAAELPPEMRDPVSSGAWWYTDGERFWWCPTEGHAQRQFALGLAQSAKPQSQESPSFLKELRPRCQADLNPNEVLLKQEDNDKRSFFFDHTGKVAPGALD